MASDLTSVTGIWRAAGEARARPCRLALDADGTATVTDGAETVARAPFPALTISDRVGSIPRHVGFPDGGDFETPDNDGIDTLKRRVKGRAGVVHEMERFRPRLFVFAALAVLLAMATYRYAVPVLVEVAVAVTPPAVTRLISRGALASLDATMLAESKLDEARRRKLTQGFDELAALAPPDSAAGTYTLNFRKGDAIGPNAFALPDGTVVLTDELVDMAGGDDELVLGVLAHEIGHVVGEHSLRQLYRAAGITGLIMLIGGDIGSATEDILVQGSALLALSHSRGAEREADRYSVELMHRAGRDPTAIARFFEILRDRLGDTGGFDFISTHPATPERIEETRRYAEEVAGATRP